MLFKHYTILIEEINELIIELLSLTKILSKFLRFGANNYDPNQKTPVSNKILLEEEIGHVQYMIQTLIKDLHLDSDNINQNIINKKEKLKVYNQFHGGDVN